MLFSGQPLPLSKTVAAPLDDSGFLGIERGSDRLLSAFGPQGRSASIGVVYAEMLADGSQLSRVFATEPTVAIRFA